MKKKQVSIYDIAKELGVSPSTVSRALNDHPRISQGVKESVRKLAKELNFSPNVAAVALKTGKVRTIGMVIPLIDRNYFVQAITAVEKRIYKAGYDLIIASSGNFYDREKKIITSMSQGKVIGLIAAVAAETTNYSHYEALVEMGVPLVMFDRKMSIPNSSSVGQDDYLGAYKATRHLIEEGCRTIYHYRGPQNVSIWSERHKGYLQAMKESNLEVDDHFIHTALTTEEEGYLYAQKILSQDTLPDGILFSGDFAAKTAMELFVSNGVRIPQDIAIVGFVNEPWDPFLNPPLSSIEQFSYKIGETAAEMMLEAIEGKPHRNVVYEPELIIRESSLKSKYL
ncbi:MAG: LacI family DNA-binding transcriptional regulator [Bacteroidales bacterium]